MFAKNLATESSQYLRLKDHRGHWHNQDRRPSIDDHQGTRHRAMIELQEHLGRTGTNTHEIEHFMGSPTKILNEPDMVLNHEFLRTNADYQYPADAKIWIYEWRGNHDYVYFVVSKDNKVIQSDWYNALE